MFNRQPFNRGKFNVAISSSDSFFGEMDISVNMSGALSVVKSFDGSVDINTQADGYIIKIHNLDGNADIVIEANNSMLIKVHSFTGESNIEVNAFSDGFNSYGYEFIKLPGLTLTPGSELIINTDDMTVELNGVNVSRYFSSDSEFFKIRPGENIVIYENGIASGRADIRILWKDAFL